MKLIKILSLVFVFIINLSAASQNTFESKYYIGNNSGFRFVKETKDGDYILLASSDENDRIIKLSHEGDSIGMLDYSIPEGDLRFFGVFDHPHFENIIIAPAVIKQTNANKIALLSFETDLDIIDIKYISFENDILDFSNRQIPISLMNEDKIEFTVLVRSLSGEYCHMFVSIDTDGNIIKQRIIQSLSIVDSLEFTERTYPYNFLIINNEPTQYLYSCFVEYPLEGMDGYFDKQFYIGIMDKDFNVKESKELDEYYKSDKMFRFVDLPKIRNLNDSTLVLQILAEDLYSELEGVAYIIFDKELNILDDNFILTPTLVRLPLLNSIEITKDHIVECKIVNSIGVPSPYYPTEIYISKYDHDLNIVSEKKISTKERFCYPMSILKTADDGCIMVGSCNDFNYNRNYLHVIKVDKKGTLSIDEEISDNNVVCSLYPNPADDNITIELSSDCHIIEIYDSFGRMMMSRQVAETLSHQVVDIDISKYPSGLYLVVVKDDNNRYYERIVKN